MKSAKYRPTAHLLEQEIGKDRIADHAIFHTKHKNLQVYCGDSGSVLGENGSAFLCAVAGCVGILAVCLFW